MDTYPFNELPEPTQLFAIAGGRLNYDEHLSEKEEKK
jgi:hypothetical protein